MAEEKINVTPEVLKRVYVDISEEVERKCRIRYLQLEMKTGTKFDRKTYIEYLINQDTATVNGASLRTVTKHKSR